MSTALDDVFYPVRAGRYDNALNSNDRLPVVYGDLTDGSSGNWRCPCIDTDSFVYAYAGSEVLSSAAGNTISVYVDDVLASNGAFSFNHADNYESEGTIATLTSVLDLGNAVVSVRGKGKASSSVLIENVATILHDFLTVENDLTTADFDATTLATTTEQFTSQGYKAAGVIAQDTRVSDILQEMMGSFLGSVYYNGDDLLVLTLETGVVPVSSVDVIPKSELILNRAVQRAVSLINECPTSYAYNYLSGEFRSHDSGTGTTEKNTASQGIYGTRKPRLPYTFYWCRDKTVVNAIQAIITSKFGVPTWEADVSDITMKRLGVDVGDVLAVTIPSLYGDDGQSFINRLMRVVSVAPDFDVGRVGFRLVDERAYQLVAYVANGAWIADGSIKAGNNRDVTAY